MTKRTNNPTDNEPTSGEGGGSQLADTLKVTCEPPEPSPVPITGSTKVSLQRSATPRTADQALWTAIRNRTEAVAFNRYREFIDRVLCASPDTTPSGGFDSPSVGTLKTELAARPTIHGTDAYHLLRLATQAFLLFECGTVINPPRDPLSGTPGDPRIPIPGEESRLGEADSLTYEEMQRRLRDYLVGADHNLLPYLDRIVNALFGLDPARRAERLPYCEAVLLHRFTCPSLLELIWSYWHEEGMLVQTINAIALRFQNRRVSAGQDPLAHLETDPLRPLNNLLWGFIQDEYTRLTVPRRAYEYDHQYGLTLYGKVVPTLSSADSRTKFLEAFHNLLYRTIVFFQQDADTTVISDGFPLLNALREVHLLLAEGAHNQFGDLPWTARMEMLTMEWLLARPEIQEFLHGRPMVPYREAWMAPVDTMKRLQGWTDASVTHFRDLGVFGEQLLLSIRYGDWIDVNNEEHARNWARYWKPEIQGYIHSYLTVTGVDLGADITDTRQASERYLQPSVHLRKRLAAQHASRPQLTATVTRGQLGAETMGYVGASAEPAGHLLGRETYK
ncbi:MAG: hypothetical protein U1F76_00400 [Candidatus Competibacteraceae bacterium]